MGLLDRGQAALARRMKQAGGRTVIYTRAGVTPVPLTMWIGQAKTTRQQNGPATAISWGDRDYLCETADFLAANLTEPLVGDRITETIAGVAHTFELMPTENGEPPWRFGDMQFRTTIRFHVKEA